VRAADGIPPLPARDADIELVSTSGKRRITLQDFVVGNRKTLRRPDEVLAAVIVPRKLDDARSSFRKLGARRYLVISIAMVTAVVKTDDNGRVAVARVAVGSCSVIAQRLMELEHDLVGARAIAGIGEMVRQKHIAGLSPINDVRATAAYRR